MQPPTFTQSTQMPSLLTHYIPHRIDVYRLTIKCYYWPLGVSEDIKVVREKGTKGRSEVSGGGYDLTAGGGVAAGNRRGEN